MKPKTIYGLIIMTNCVIGLLAINSNIKLFHYLGIIVAVATIALLVYIKLFRRESKLFDHVTTKQTMIYIFFLTMFVLMGFVYKHLFINQVLQ